MTVTLERKPYIPWEQVNGQRPLEEGRRSNRLFLAREEFEAVLGIGVVEMRRDVGTANDQETAVRDTDRRWVPTLREELKVGILEHSAAYTVGRRAWLEETDGLISRFYCGVVDEATLITADASLKTMTVRSDLRRFALS